MTAAGSRTDYAALSERMGRLMLLRLALAVMVVAWSAVRQDGLGVPLLSLVGASVAYVAASIAFEAARRGSARLGFALLTTLLLLDGLYLAFAMYATGGTQSPLRFLTYLHLVAVSLLASYRTGLKIALWHSLLLFVVLYAQAARLLPPVDVEAGRAITFDSLPVLNVTSFWLFALATSIFSAMNERELRQRRLDLEALVEMGARLDDTGDPTHQARIVLDGLEGRFGFKRGAVLGASGDRVVVLAARGTATPPTGPTRSDPLIATAWARREPLAVKGIDGERNQLLAYLLPGARNVLIAPMIADGRAAGAIVVEHRGRNLFGVERRVISVLAQVAATAALNMRNAVLLRHVQDLAERDSLTGAANRRMFQDTLEQTLSRRPNPAAPLTAVLFIDLDDFKIVNDTLGHAAGDALLVAVTERISHLVREEDLVARLGGDEFAILASDDADMHRALAMAKRLVNQLRSPYLLGEHRVMVTASIGIASAGDGPETAADLVRNADVAMYMAKANGKAGFAVFDPGMHAAMRDRHELGLQLQRAVERGELRLVYQPIASLDGTLAGMEALVRWDHPERGMIAPAEFIEIAEENGTIVPIGRWVLGQACRDARNWIELPNVRDDLFLSVNVSAREIGQDGFAAEVASRLREADLAPERLMIEITETALLKATPGTLGTLEELRALGIRVAIDDFGTGYFSLSHLRQFPIDSLKIASEFVQISESDSRSAVLAGAIVALGRSLGIMTIAEGIETAEQASRVRDLGCTYGQGYFFAPPMPAEQLSVEMANLVAAEVEARPMTLGPVSFPAMPSGLPGIDPRPA